MYKCTVLLMVLAERQRSTHHGKHGGGSNYFLTETVNILKLLLSLALNDFYPLNITNMGTYFMMMNSIRALSTNSCGFVSQLWLILCPEQLSRNA